MASRAPIRGLKGLWWEPEQYLGWPRFLAGAGYDFLMLCYTFCPETSLRWRRPIREAEEAVIRRLAEECAEQGVELCLAINPCIGGQGWRPDRAAVPFHPTSGPAWFRRAWQARRPDDELVPDRPIRYDSDADLALLVDTCRRARDWGVRAFALCLDDIEPSEELSAGGLGEAQGRLLAELQLELRSADGAARLLMAPTYYWTTGARAHPDYLAGLARRLPPDVDLFWTGPAVRSHAITAGQAREAATLFGRKPVVWLNHASNDSFRFALQLPPARPPAPDLLPETAGLLLNPMRQVGLTRLHALVIGEYLRDPAGYDHDRAVERATAALVGHTAAPLLGRVLAAWAAYPDPRTLPADLAGGGRPFVEDVVARLSSARAVLDEVLPRLDGLLDDPAIRAELRAGVARFRLLSDALELLHAEGEYGGATLAAERAALGERLARVDEETACDALAVLKIGPANPS